MELYFAIRTRRTPLQKGADETLRGRMSAMHRPSRREKTEDGSAPSISPHAKDTSKSSNTKSMWYETASSLQRGLAFPLCKVVSDRANGYVICSELSTTPSRFSKSFHRKMVNKLRIEIRTYTMNGSFPKTKTRGTRLNVNAARHPLSIMEMNLKQRSPIGMRIVSVEPKGRHNNL